MITDLFARFSDEELLVIKRFAQRFNDFVLDTIEERCKIVKADAEKDMKQFLTEFDLDDVIKNQRLDVWVITNQGITPPVQYLEDLRKQ